MLKELSAVADGSRREILARLLKGERCACEIPALVKKTQPAVSQHLKVLREAGLVKMQKFGKMRIYSASDKGRRIMEDISKW
jgi:ArsR family transcriptional regulator, lead/cadmium/zinc/bismuth-responsive transcriptional repressor